MISYTGGVHVLGDVLSTNYIISYNIIGVGRLKNAIDCILVSKSIHILGVRKTKALLNKR